MTTQNSKIPHTTADTTPSDTKVNHPNDTTIRIFDTPIQSLPHDLYIPPQAFAVWLEQFEGPLDFLLYLVKKNNFDLTETAILPITEQYLSYISELGDVHFELAGDYLLMASTLIAIKSELLLPTPTHIDDEVSPKKQLIRRLEEYAQIKHAAKNLDNLIRLERDVFLALTSLPTPEVMAKELPNYPSSMLVNSLITMQIKPDYQMHTVKTDPVPLPMRIAQISTLLSQQGEATFWALLDKTQGKLGAVVSFVAVLELMKRGLVGFAEPVEPTNTNTDNNIDTAEDSTTDSPDTHHLAAQKLYWLH